MLPEMEKEYLEKVKGIKPKITISLIIFIGTILLYYASLDFMESLQVLFIGLVIVSIIGISFYLGNHLGSLATFNLQYFEKAMFELKQNYNLQIVDGQDAKISPQEIKRLFPKSSELLVTRSMYQTAIMDDMELNVCQVKVVSNQDNSIVFTGTIFKMDLQNASDMNYHVLSNNSLDEINKHYLNQIQASLGEVPSIRIEDSKVYVAFPKRFPIYSLIEAIHPRKPTLKLDKMIQSWKNYKIIIDALEYKKST